MGDLHQVVVHNIGQVIGGQLVGTLVEHLIVEDIALHVHLATDHVVDKDLLAGINLEAHHILLAVGNQPVHLFFRHGQRVAHHQARLVVVLEVLYLLTLLLQFLGRVEGDIGLAALQQHLHILLIDVAALALTIGAIVAAEADTLVELDAQPAEGLDDISLSLGNETGGVGILDAEHQVAAMLTGKQIVIQGSAHTADM